MVRVNQPRHHDSVRRVDHFGSGLQVGSEGGDLLSFNQHIGFLKVADVAIHTQYDAAFEQNAASVRSASGGSRGTLN